MPAKARAKLRWIIGFMETRKDWGNTPYFSPLVGYAGIGEIKFKAQNKQYRPLGCYGPGIYEFTLLIGSEEKGDKFKPLSAPETAVKRRKLILQDARYTDDYY